MTSLNVAIEVGGGHVEAVQGSHDERVASIGKAITVAGGKVVDEVAEADALIWLSEANSEDLAVLLDANPKISWVQLPWAGVEPFAAAGAFDRPTTFTSARGAYGSQTGDQAFMLTMACLRNAVEHARTKHWIHTEPRSLAGLRATVLGAGGIAKVVVRYLNAGEASVTVLRRSGEPLEGAGRTLPVSALHDVLPETDILIVAVPLTPETTGIVGATELALLPRGAIVVNVGRGRHVDTAALTESLRSGHLAGAGLDVTEPEPLPADHPLWQMDNVLITSHCGNSQPDITTKLSRRVAENVRRRISGEALEGLVDPKAGF